MTLLFTIAAAVGIAATVDDLRRGHIANWIPALALAGGVVCHGWSAGWSGLGSALAGAAAGFGIFLIFYLLGGMGAGDIKLMGGFGALLGLPRLLEATVLTAMAGGLIAAGVVAWAAVRKWRTAGAAGEVKYIPYAPAITLGAWLSLMPKT